MNKFNSAILRIGLINSGMFDLLELNTNVKAIHLIGANNVGKTSLIELIQFLYFHNVKEMTFSKSSSESLAFYFRPEGSYILFEVHTVHRTKRTVGIFGKGSADSREIFVFDGPFLLDDFVDDTNRVLPLQQAQDRFFNKNFRKYKPFDQYEKALIGSNSESELNVQMFDLSLHNFRMLRKLMQGLLRLDRLTSSQVRQFIIGMVEKGGVKTRISIVADYERKNREITDIRIKLNHLMGLKPTIEKWQGITDKIQRMKEQIKTASERLFHLSFCYLTNLNHKKSELQAEYDTAKRKQDALSVQNEELVKKKTESERDLTELIRSLRQFDELNRYCSRFDRIHIQRERDQLTYQTIRMEEVLDQIKPENADILRKQLKQRRIELERIRRQMENRTLDQVWIRENFSGEHIALLRFLLSRNLISLPVSSVITDEGRFLKISRQMTAYLNDHGAFVGFGLVIPKSEWYVSEEDTEPLEAQKQRIQKEIRKLEEKLEVAENREKKESDLRELRKIIQEKENILGRFGRLDQWKDSFHSREECEANQLKFEADIGKIKEAIRISQQNIKQVQNNLENLHTQLSSIERTIQETNQAHQAIKEFSTECPLNIKNMPETDLEFEYRQSKSRLREREDDFKRLENVQQEHRASLESHYDRESPDIDFEQWIKKNLDITAQIAKFEIQLTEAYNNLFSRIKGELDKLTQAYEAVSDQVATLNRNIRNISISNIERIELDVKKSHIVEAIRKTFRGQMDIFSIDRQDFPSDQAQKIVDSYLSEIRDYGREIDLKDMFQLEFRVRFIHNPKEVQTPEIHKFESHGTETGIKIVLYLGLIGLLQERRKALSARIPFFLDEVGSIDSHNLKQLIQYCYDHNFLPIFASPNIRNDVPCNYIFKRDGDRSVLINEIFLTESEGYHNETSPVDQKIA
ncbi:ATP-binding protein [Desulfococcaceae bacterium HSG7]|nr:ATP-binding protein [Desulfococcaceae bacterium HSG7]